ncbi:hypothetical protein [Streptomyces canus]|uniref:hypothetical protein n=1 Tax=Streptomyces canus TaxID=58343 RepID=UPI0036ED3CE6
MAPLTLVSRLRRYGKVSPAVPLAAAHAALSSVVGTTLAVASYHVAFGVAPSWAARGLATLLLFALSAPGTRNISLFRRQLAVAVIGQLLAGAVFSWTAGNPVAALATAAPLVVAHAGLTLTVAWLLHTMASGRSRALRAAGRELCLMCAWLVRLLLFPAHVFVGPSGPVVTIRSRTEVVRPCLLDLLLMGSVVRRGPPLSLSYAAR